MKRRYETSEEEEEFEEDDYSDESEVEDEFEQTQVRNSRWLGVVLQNAQ